MNWPTVTPYFGVAYIMGLGIVRGGSIKITEPLLNLRSFSRTQIRSRISRCRDQSRWQKKEKKCETCRFHLISPHVDFPNRPQQLQICA